MIITNTSLEALRTAFRTEFQRGLTKVAPKYGVFTTTVPSTTKLSTYGFLGSFPIFRKWIGEKRIRSLEEKAYQLENEDFEVTIGIHKHKIEDDNLGLYPAMFSGWGEEAGQLADRLAFASLAAGHQRLCYDGQYFFDTDHPMAAGVVSNVDTTGAVQPWYLLDCSKPLKPLLHQERKKPVFNMVVDPTDSHVFKTGEYLAGGEARGSVGYTWWQLAYKSTATLNEANFKAGRDYMMAITDDEGEPLGVRPTHIIVGRSNVVAARNLFEKANLAGGESNIWYKDVMSVEAERLP